MNEPETVEMPFPIAGIGASAGGLQPLQELVGAIPPGSGIAYVIVQHLAPDHHSILDTLLAPCTQLPVSIIEDDMVVSPDRIFLAPAAHVVTLERGRFRAKPSREIGVRTPIDRLFASLAEHSGENAFCIVLSGTGSYGTEGLRRVKAAGGTAIVQGGASARFSGMPDSARATGLVDLSLTPGEIPGRIMKLLSGRADWYGDAERDALFEELHERLPELKSLLALGADGHDFDGYKSGTLVRRTERRMMLTHHRSVAAFLDTLRSDAEERKRLVQDFMIGVTTFFRDPEAFEAFAMQLLPPLVERVAGSGVEKLRVWAPGCSTGEETYSVAMLVLEAMEAAGSTQQGLQVFGTDIDAAALYHARQGVYSAASVADLDRPLAERYLRPQQGRFRVNSVLRDVCVFAQHDLVRDPPFSRVDLIVCRNLLIYLNQEVQRRLFHKLHYALNSRGALFLGSSETAGPDKLFREIDWRHRLYERKDDVPDSYSSLGAARGVESAGYRRPASMRHIGRSRPPLEDQPLELRVERAFLQQLAAPFAVVDAAGSVVYLSEAMTRFVRPTSGTPSTGLDSFLAQELRLPAHSVIAEARRECRRRSTDCRVELPEGKRTMRLVAMPLEGTEGEVMIALHPLEQPVTRSREERDGDDRAEVEQLEQELLRTRRDLEIALTEYDSSNQELRSSNEELQSTNVELQSANEELETSREELRSINEELQTMNAELSENVDRLRRANSDLKNLFESTELATLFLDPQLRVRSFTPRTNTLFNIRARDVGRPLTDIACRLTYDSLESDANEVLRTLGTIEREVEVEASGETYIMRTRPYRTVDDRLDGLVLTFFDISARKRQEHRLAENEIELRRQYAELETLYASTPVGLALVDRELRWLRINEELATINGFPAAEHIGKRQEELIPDIDASVSSLQRAVFESGEPARGIEVSGTTPAEPHRLRDWVVDYYPVFAGEDVFAVGCCMREVTEQKRLERQLQSYVDRLRLAVRLHPIHFHEVDAEGRLLFALSEHPVLPDHRAIGERLVDMLPEQLRGEVEDCLGQATATGEGSRRDISVEVARTTYIYELNVEPVSNPNENENDGALLVWFDVTERKSGEDRAVLLLAELEHRVKNMLGTIIAIVRSLARSARSAEHMGEQLSERLHAMARTYALLTASDSVALSLHQLIGTEFAPYKDALKERLQIAGPDFTLGSREVLAIGMAAHELTTNSVKHGALSVPDGRVEITTRLSEHRCGFTWRERGGAPIATERRRGFGLFLLEEVLPAQVHGEVELAFEENGLCFTIDFQTPKFRPSDPSLLGRSS